MYTAQQNMPQGKGTTLNKGYDDTHTIYLSTYPSFNGVPLPAV